MAIVPKRDEQGQEMELQQPPEGARGLPRWVPKPRLGRVLKTIGNIPNQPAKPAIDISEVEPIDMADVSAVETVADRAGRRLARQGIVPGRDGRYPVIEAQRDIKLEQLDPSTALSGEHMLSRAGSMLSGATDLITGIVPYGRDLYERGRNRAAKAAGIVPADGRMPVDPRAALGGAAVELGSDILGSVRNRYNDMVAPGTSIPRRVADATAIAAAPFTFGSTTMLADQADTIPDSPDPLRSFASTVMGSALTTEGGRQAIGTAIGAGTDAVVGGLDAVRTSRPMQRVGRQMVNRHLGPDSVGDFGQNAGRGIGEAGLVAGSDEALLGKVTNSITDARARKQMLLASPIADTLAIDMRAPVMEVLGEKPLAITAGAAGAWDQFAQRVVQALSDETGGTFQMTPAQADAFKYRIGADFERTFADADYTIKKKGQQLYSAVDRTIEQRLPGYGEIDAHLADLHQAQTALEVGMRQNEYRRGILEQPIDSLPVLGRQMIFQRNTGTRSGAVPLLLRTGFASATHDRPPFIESPLSGLNFERPQVGAGAAPWSMDVQTGQRSALPPLDYSRAVGEEFFGDRPVHVGEWVNPQLNRPALPPAADATAPFAPIQGGQGEWINPQLNRPALPSAAGAATVQPSTGVQWNVDTPNNPAFWRGRQGVVPEGQQPSGASAVPQRPTTPEIVSTWAGQELEQRRPSAGPLSMAEETAVVNNRPGANKSVVPQRPAVGNALRENTRLSDEQIANVERTVTPTAVPKRQKLTQGQPRQNVQEPAQQPRSAARPEPQVRTPSEAAPVPQRRSSTGGDADNVVRTGDEVFDPQTGTRGPVERIVEFGTGSDTRRFVRIRGAKNLVPLDRVQRGKISGGGGGGTE